MNETETQHGFVIDKATLEYEPIEYKDWKGGKLSVKTDAGNGRHIWERRKIEDSKNKYLRSAWSLRSYVDSECMQRIKALSRKRNEVCEWKFLQAGI